VLPSSARASGVGGAFYTTEITLANTGILDASFTLKFLSHDVDGTNGPEKTMTIGAGKSLASADVLKSVFGLESGYGAIRVTSNNSDLILAGQTSIPGDGGSYGQSVPGMLAGLWEEFLNTICGIREDQAFRSNLIMANLSTVERNVDVSLIDETGLVLAAKSYKIPPMGDDSTFPGYPATWDFFGPFQCPVAIVDRDCRSVFCRLCLGDRQCHE
jgi:hypothetical protein